MYWWIIIIIILYINIGIYLFFIENINEAGFCFICDDQLNINILNEEFLWTYVKINSRFHRNSIDDYNIVLMSHIKIYVIKCECRAIE